MPLRRMGELGTVAQAIKTIVAGDWPLNVWYFGADAHGSFITDRAFLAYVTEAEQAHIMEAMGITPGHGTWSAWQERDISDEEPVPDVAAAIADFTATDPLAEDTGITWTPDHQITVHFYRVEGRIVPIDARYQPLLAARAVRCRYPVGAEGFWIADGDRVEAAVMRCRVVDREAMAQALRRVAEAVT